MNFILQQLGLPREPKPRGKWGCLRPGFVYVKRRSGRGRIVERMCPQPRQQPQSGQGNAPLPTLLTNSERTEVAEALRKFQQCANDCADKCRAMFASGRPDPTGRGDGYGGREWVWDDSAVSASSASFKELNETALKLKQTVHPFILRVSWYTPGWLCKDKELISALAIAFAANPSHVEPLATLVEPLRRENQPA